MSLYGLRTVEKFVDESFLSPAEFLHPRRVDKHKKTAQHSTSKQTRFRN